MKQPWYTKSWGIITIIFFVGIIIFGIGTYKQVKYYKQVYEKEYQDNLKNRLVSLQSDKIIKKQEVSLKWEDIITTDDPAFGPKNATVTVVVFHDFQCPFCKEESQVIKQIKQAYGDKIRFILRDYPNLYENSLSLTNAVASECVDEQGKFWEFFDLIYDNPELAETKQLINWAGSINVNVDEFKKCLDEGRYELEVKNDLDEGVKAGVEGTPTFFINGQKYSGYMGYQTLVKIIESQLK